MVLSLEPPEPYTLFKNEYYTQPVVPLPHLLVYFTQLAQQKVNDAEDFCSLAVNLDVPFHLK